MPRCSRPERGTTTGGWSAARRGGSGVQRDSTPIARRNVPTYNPDGSWAGYIARATALELARQEQADWADSDKQSLHIRAQIHIPRGKLGQWVPRPSGFAGPLVLQFQ